jgi:hypothetical protein
LPRPAFALPLLCRAGSVLPCFARRASLSLSLPLPPLLPLPLLLSLLLPLPLSLPVPLPLPLPLPLQLPPPFFVSCLPALPPTLLPALSGSCSERRRLTHCSVSVL